MSSLFRTKEIDLNNVVITNDTYYFCTDTHRLYYDDNSLRNVIPCNIINTEIDRVNNTVGTNGLMYYVWENNTLWVFRGGWVQVAGVVYKTNGYYYSENGIVEADTSDGSLYIRDTNNIIKAKIRVNSINNKLEVLSMPGGGITFYPSGASISGGTLDIEPILNNGIATNTANYTIKGNVYVNIDGVVDKLVTQTELNNISPCISSISNNSILEQHIANNAVGYRQIINNNIFDRHINDNAINGRHINSNIVNSQHINSNAICNRHIVNNAIESKHINNNSIINTKIANNSIELRHLSDEVINYITNLVNRG